ncbi:MAG: pentapeptide repeat-containing protein [Alphaproteobacteria bacterium]|nr:pentapeptide repeat-containing protein [Alphaproteobacteria bacterium]
MEDSEFAQTMDESRMYLKGLSDVRRENLSGRSLIGFNALKERLAKAILAGMDFIGSELSGSYFTDADLPGLMFWKYGLTGVKFHNVDLWGQSLPWPTNRIA